MNLSNNVPILTQSVMETASFGFKGAFENPMRTTFDSIRDCIHEHLQGSSMGPDKEASTLSTGSWHSSDCLSLLTFLMPSKRQYSHRKTRQWERQRSQCHSKWNRAGSQNKPSPLCCLGGWVFYHSNRNGANLKYKAEEYRAQPDGTAVAAVKNMEPLSHAAGESAGTSVRAGCCYTGRRINGFSRKEAVGAGSRRQAASCQV